MCVCLCVCHNTLHVVLIEYLVLQWLFPMHQKDEKIPVETITNHVCLVRGRAGLSSKQICRQRLKSRSRGCFLKVYKLYKTCTRLVHQT